MAKQLHKQFNTLGRMTISDIFILGRLDSSFQIPGSNHHSPQGMVAIRSICYGSGNNLAHPDLNAVGSDFARVVGPARFRRWGVCTTTTGPNPRDISNIVVAGNGDLPNPEGLSGMMYAWGQFIDHDLDLMQAGGTDISIIALANSTAFARRNDWTDPRPYADRDTGEGTGSLPPR